MSLAVDACDVWVEEREGNFFDQLERSLAPGTAWNEWMDVVLRRSSGTETSEWGIMMVIKG